MTSDWSALLDAGEPAQARAVWQEKFSADSDSLEATWELEARLSRPGASSNLGLPEFCGGKAPAQFP